MLRETDEVTRLASPAVSPISWSGVDSQLCVDGLLLHDVHDGPAGVGGTFRCGVNRDGLLRRACVFFPVNVDPGAKKQHR